MATRVVGLDIGTFAVRAAEMTVGTEPPILNAFGQVTLPPGAVRNGEIVDTEAVGAAVRRLWAEARLSARTVVVGVANQRVIVRQAELPAMTEEDMRSALQFEAQELIPIPVEDAILDFQILEQVAGPEGEARARILLAAAQRDMIRTHIAAVERGGLTPTTVDLVPFALIRSLYRPSAEFFAETGGAEAIVSVGAGVTNVVVHEDGVPRFVRILLVGGEDITEAIAQELEVDIDLAEDLKRRADERSSDTLVADAGRIVTGQVTPIVDEIRGSLDFYLAQADSLPVARILVTGGASRTRGLFERLQQTLGNTVEAGHPLASLRIGRTGLTETQLADAEPILAVPIGLALGGAPTERGTRRITLVPTEVVEVREQRRQLVLAATAVAGLLALLIVVWLWRGLQVNRERDRAEEAERRAQALQQEVNQLQDVTALQADLDRRQAIVRGVLTGDVAWTRLLQQVAVAIPNDVWLTSFTGARGTGAAPSTVTFNAMGFDQSSTARWLLRIGDVSSLTGLWVPSSTKQPGPRGLTTFTSTANLTPAANSDRAQEVVTGQS